LLKEKKKKYVGSGTTPYINQGKGDTFPKSRESPPTGKRRNCEVLESDKPSPAPDQLGLEDLESNWILHIKGNKALLKKERRRVMIFFLYS